MPYSELPARWMKEPIRSRATIEEIENLSNYIARLNKMNDEFLIKYFFPVASCSRPGEEYIFNLSCFISIKAQYWILFQLLPFRRIIFRIENGYEKTSNDTTGDNKERINLHSFSRGSRDLKWKITFLQKSLRVKRETIY